MSAQARRPRPSGPQTETDHRTLARELTVAAIETWHQAVRRADDAGGRHEAAEAALMRQRPEEETREERDRWESWSYLAHLMRDDAENRLISAILAWGDDVQDHMLTHAAKWSWEPRGFVHGGTLYLAARVHQCNTPAGGGGNANACDVMALSVINLDSIVHMPPEGIPI